MRMASRRDYLQGIYRQYREASREEKGGILHEFCANCRYHRKHAVRLLNGPPPSAETSSDTTVPQGKLWARSPCGLAADLGSGRSSLAAGLKPCLKEGKAVTSKMEMPKI